MDCWILTPKAQKLESKHCLKGLDLMGSFCQVSGKRRCANGLDVFSAALGALPFHEVDVTQACHSGDATAADHKATK